MGYDLTDQNHTILHEMGHLLAAIKYDFYVQTLWVRQKGKPPRHSFFHHGALGGVGVLGDGWGDIVCTLAGAAVDRHQKMLDIGTENDLLDAHEQTTRMSQSPWAAQDFAEIGCTVGDVDLAYRQCWETAQKLVNTNWQAIEWGAAEFTHQMNIDGSIRGAKLRNLMYDMRELMR
ncbi:hypothetical protein [Halothiobacillus sp.]|jgi:hypothetical protein|uniref:hypothetical protein n=1 Tax=Halothiobacillus sp. TaxID=1891311 RepID=UPI003D0A0FB6